MVRSVRVPSQSTWEKVRVTELIPVQLPHSSAIAVTLRKLDYKSFSRMWPNHYVLKYFPGKWSKLHKWSSKISFSSFSFLWLCLMLCCLLLLLYWMLCPLSSPLLLDRDLMVSVLSLERALPSAVISCFLGSLLGTHCVCVWLHVWVGELCVHADMGLSDRLWVWLWLWVCVCVCVCVIACLF